MLAGSAEARELKQGFDDGLFQEGDGTLADVDLDDDGDGDEDGVAAEKWADEADDWDEDDFEDDDPLREDDRRRAS